MNIKEKLRQYQVDATDRDLEYLIRDAECVYRGNLTECQWYYYQERVAKINYDFFVSYQYVSCTGDGEIPDFDWGSVYEVKPVQKMMTVYERVI